MVSFLRAQILEIRDSKRLLATLLFAPVPLLFCSYNAANSWIPEQVVLAMFSALVAMLSSEILHWLTIDEIKDGLFDIYLISPINQFQIMLCKLIIPIIGGVGLAVITLLINNYLSLYDHFLRWEFSLVSCSFLLFAAIFSALLEFVSLMLVRRNSVNIHFFILAGNVFFMIWVYDISLYNRPLYYILILFLTFLASITVLILLRKRYQMQIRKNTYCFPRLFENADTSLFGAFYRKNISTLRCERFVLLQFVVAVISPIVLGIVANNLNLFSTDTIIIVSLSAIPSIANAYLVLYSFLFENRNKVSDILRIRKISTAKRILEKSISSGLTSSVLCIICFLLNLFFNSCNFLILPFTLINCFLSALLCGLYSCRIDSFKAENIHKVFISLVSVVLQCGLLFLMSSLFGT